MARIFLRASLTCLFLGFGILEAGASGLVATYDQRGIAALSYNGVSLVDLNSGLGDAFQIWNYTLGSAGGFGGHFTSWDAVNQTLTWTGNWGGTVSAQFATPAGTDNLVITMTVQNPTAQILTNVVVYPLGLQFPTLPNNFFSPVYPQFHNNIDGPVLIPADYGTGLMVLADNDAKPLYVGLHPSGPANHYFLEVGTFNDCYGCSEGFMGTAAPLTRTIPAGGSDTYTISLRFAPSGTDYHAIAGDVLTTFGQTWPSPLKWTDRRPIGSLFMTSPTNSYNAPSGPNPRGYTMPNTNIQTPAGLAAFQQAVLAYADNAVQVLKNTNAQGGIVWDLEGQQFPQDNGGGPGPCGAIAGAISYVGSPDLLPQLSPEMNGIADAFFKKFTDAGLKCGMTIRPQQVIIPSDPSQSSQSWCPVRNGDAATVTSLLVQKMQYANNRWGCTLFYVDSDGGPDDSVSPAIWQAVVQALPPVLIFPENIWSKDWAYTAPYLSYDGASFKPMHTPADERTIWPTATALTYIGDAPNHDLTNNPADPNQWNEFVQAVKGGDILSFRAWFDDEPLNSQVKQIYQQAGVGGTPPPAIVLHKSAAPLTAKSKDTVTFTIGYQNTSGTAATNVVISDAIPTGSTLVTGSIIGGGTVAAGTITWNLGTVAGNGSGTVSFQVTVN